MYANSKVERGIVRVECPRCNNLVPKPALRMLLTPENSSIFDCLWEVDAAPDELLHPVPGLIELFEQLAARSVFDENAKDIHSHGIFIAPWISSTLTINNSLFDSKMFGPIQSSGLTCVSVSLPVSFHYYDCRGELDRGWGCTYRCLQTVLSCLPRDLSAAIERDVKNFTCQYTPVDGFTNRVPRVVDIQNRLADIKSVEDKWRNSQRWIEPSHVADYLNSYGVPCHYATFSLTAGPGAHPGTDAEHFALCAALWRHFSLDPVAQLSACGGVSQEALNFVFPVPPDTNFTAFRTPIVCDDGVRTVCVCGVALDPRPCNPNDGYVELEAKTFSNGQAKVLLNAGATLVSRTVLLVTAANEIITYY
jgi:hypothetical protein